MWKSPLNQKGPCTERIKNMTAGIIVIVALIAFCIGVCLVFDVFNVFHKDTRTKEEREHAYDQVIYGQKKRTLSEIVDYYRGKKGFFLVREVNTAKSILGETGRAKEYGKTIISCVLLSMLGASIGFLLKNVVAIGVLSVGFFLFPIWRLKLYRNKYRKYLAQQLESGLSLVTASYIRCNDITIAVRENVDHMSSLLQPYFRDFLTETEINPSLKNCVRDLRDRINDSIFKEWCEMLLRTLDNAEMKESLLPIIAKYSSVRIVQDEVDTELSSAMIEYIVMMGFAVFVYVLVYMLNKEWFEQYYTFGGQLVMGYSLITLLFSVAKLATIRKPVQYKR